MTRFSGQKKSTTRHLIPSPYSGNRFTRRTFLKTGAILCTLFFCIIPSKTHASWERESARAWAAVDFFPSVLAADQNILEKQEEDDHLLLLLLYRSNLREAKKLSTHLEKIGTIRGVPIRVELTNDPSFTAYANRHIGGIFLTEKYRQKLDLIIAYGQKKSVIILSPFRGDVERGIPVGISITDKIQLYININALQASAIPIQIKPFFLRVAKRYER